MPLDCLEENIDYTGQILKTLTIDGILDCQWICVMEVLCQFWSWNFANSQCKLLSEMTSENSVNKVYSGSKDCHLPGLKIEGTIF